MNARYVIGNGCKSMDRFLGIIGCPGTDASPWLVRTGRDARPTLGCWRSILEGWGERPCPPDRGRPPHETPRHPGQPLKGGVSVVLGMEGQAPGISPGLISPCPG